MSSRLFEVLICHGSYHTPAHYAPLIDAFQDLGVPATCPQQPSTDPIQLNALDGTGAITLKNPSPPSGYPGTAEDAAAINSQLVRLIEHQSKNILVIGHSAGGVSATEACIKELSLEERSKQGKQGGIIGIFFYTAFTLKVGNSISQRFVQHYVRDGKYEHVQFSHAHPDTPLKTIEPEYFYNDVPEDIWKPLSETSTPTPTMLTPLTNNAYAVYPCAYVVCEKDLVLTPDFQRKMLAEAEEQGGKKFTVYTAPTSHSPQVSWPKELAALAVEFGTKYIT